MVSIVSNEIRENWREVATDPVLIQMADGLRIGIDEGEFDPAQLSSFEFMMHANRTYREYGGQVELLTMGAVIQALRIALDLPEADN